MIDVFVIGITLLAFIICIFRDKVNDKAVKELPETSIVIKTQDKSSEG